MEDAQKTKREESSAGSGAAVCPSKKLDRAAVESQIRQTTGPEYWRSLEELAGTSEFREMLHREFPKGASEWVNSVSRRGFLQLMGASLAMAGMTGCTKLPLEPIVPYVRQPEELIPGRPRFYASAITLSASGPDVTVGVVPSMGSTAMSQQPGGGLSGVNASQLLPNVSPLNRP
jgi:molybdopterin-containing oxidoreductase family iron-sulfur binding subunit